MPFRLTCLYEIHRISSGLGSSWCGQQSSLDIQWHLARVFPVKMKRMRVDNAAITSEQCCHALLFCISRGSISLDAGVASLGLWMHSVEADVKTRFHLLHLTEERLLLCHTRLFSLSFIHSCKVSIANMKCNMWKGDVMLKCLSQQGEPDSLVHP